MRNKRAGAHRHERLAQRGSQRGVEVVREDALILRQKRGLAVDARAANNYASVVLRRARCAQRRLRARRAQRIASGKQQQQQEHTAAA
jgi:hypothetical protein